MYSQSEGCSSAPCSSCELNNVENLRSLVQSVVNETIQGVQQQLKESIQGDSPGIIMIVCVISYLTLMRTAITLDLFIYVML